MKALSRPFRPASIELALMFTAAASGLAAGFLLWGEPPNWYAVRDVAKLPAGPETDLIVYGYRLITDTQRYVGPEVADPALRYAGNNLACSNCHLRAGLQPFAAPFVSTYTTYPMIVDDRVVTLSERINGCMTRSMNGRALPSTGHEMKALLAYIEFLGKGCPTGVRVPGMGLRPLRRPDHEPDASLGQRVYAVQCARCHGVDGQGLLRSAQPLDGYQVPPLWGAASFNSAAGMSQVSIASAFVHANMPLGVDQGAAPPSTQDAWDVAAFFTSEPRPPGPPRN
jgi:thiosulfate dehydrogenase